MAHIPYPSTPNFRNFKTDYLRTLNWKPPVDEAEGSPPIPAKPRPPTRATFFGTVKLHGTNATIVFRNNDPAPQIQSRSWIIQGTKQDNCGTYALLSRAPLGELVKQILRAAGREDGLFEEVYIAGEVAGKGVQKGVAITQMERFFAIFNIRIDGHWVDMREYKDCALPEHRIFNVAQYRTFEVDIDFTAPTNEVYERMEGYTTEVCASCPFGTAFVDGAGKKIAGSGEGIVWTMVHSPYLGAEEFDDTILYNFKTKGEAFATTAYMPKEAKNVDPAVAHLAAQFANFALGERRFEQGIEFLEAEQARQGLKKDPYNSKLTGQFIGWVVADAIREEKNEMQRLGVLEKDAKKEISGRARIWFAKKCAQVANELTT
ncbi:Glycoside hydrolase family 5 protein [Mycena kentingensis (nom. inval.)]|nr:Glycoside hydrolase family 5 protein [Mycena kentingensis (nom. inval.)]